MSLIIDVIKKNLLISILVVIGTVLTVALMLGGTFTSELSVKSVSPQQGQTETLYQTDPEIITFSEPIDSKTAKISISPNIKFAIKTDTTPDGGGRLIIFPIPWWNYDTPYLITVNKSLTGTGGTKLKNDFIFSFSLIFPKTEDLPAQPGPPANGQY
jgi:hypothetical protein